MKMSEYDQLNADWGNLDLRDTQDLNEILDVLESGDTKRAMDLLDDFIARRGYDENAGDWCERCRALIDGGNPFSRYCDACIDSEADQ
jgi:hypothetical protein